jgi:hypothetical protein
MTKTDDSGTLSYNSNSSNINIEVDNNTNGLLQPNTTYTIYERLCVAPGFRYQTTSGGSVSNDVGNSDELDLQFETGWGNSNTNTISLRYITYMLKPTYNFQMTEVAADGLRVSESERNFFVSNGSSWVMKSGRTAIGIDGDADRQDRYGIWIALPVSYSEDNTLQKVKLYSDLTISSDGTVKFNKSEILSSHTVLNSMIKQ